jgi:hypothetical protein
MLLLDEAADLGVRAEPAVGRDHVVGDLALEARRSVHLVPADNGERLEDADRELQPAELRARIGDLRLKVDVDVPQPDPPQRRVGRRGVARRSADREQRDVVQDNVRREQADIAADLDLAGIRLAEGKVRPPPPA